MSIAAEEGTPLRLPVHRLFWLPIGMTGAIALGVLGGLVVVSWHGLDRIERVQAHLSHVGGLQDLSISIEQALLHGLRNLDQVGPIDLTELGRQVDRVVARAPAMPQESLERLRRISGSLRDTQGDTVETLFQSLAELRRVLDSERQRHDQLLHRVGRDTQAELELSLVLVGVSPLVGTAALLVLRRRVKQPLSNLGELLMRLAARDYRPVPEAAVGASALLVQPVFRSYNELVARLRQLEAERNDREQTLEQEVRRASEALLTQSRQLAQAERLAAVGTVSAGLAHELRNPLAGIQMACSKLQRALGDGDQSVRLQAVNAELKRLNRLLTDRVEAARHAPEPLTPVHLKGAVQGLLALVRYQVPKGVRLVAEIPEEIRCRLPEGGLRQALLNLVLNGAQALGDAQGTVEISARREGATVAISISDTGPGFPPQLLTVGIRPFSSGRVGGTGLGLAMVRRFTEDINGDLELSNLQPQGARVTLRVPCTELPVAGQSPDSGGVNA